MRTTIDPIPQWYDGVKFRSTLEARWAVFFNVAEIGWEYEPEGYVVGGKPYRPDFLLPDCATWVEVKGDPARLDLDLMRAAASELPHPGVKYESGPDLMILGQLPPPPGGCGDWGFVSLNRAFPLTDPPEVEFTYWGFGRYHKNIRPWWLDAVDALPSDTDLANRIALESRFCEWEFCDGIIEMAYATARAHRFGRR